MPFERVLGIHIIIAANVFLCLGLFVTYGISVGLGHVKPLWCYISYTGDYPIESCIFSVVLNLVSIAYFLVVYLRHAQMSAVLFDQNLSEKAFKRLSRFNSASLFFGLSGTFGLSMTACFQHRLFHLAHVTGVFLTTYFTLVYFILQTYLSYAVASLSTAFTKRVRLAIAVLSCLILSAGPGFFAYFLLYNFQDFEMFEADKDIHRDGVVENIGAVFEWILFSLYHMFIYSFCPDFKKIALEKDQIVFL